MRDTDAALKAVAADARAGASTSALLAGAAGAAGAKAAETLAARLGTTVYRIDLAALSSKYIGETEKNLSALFAEAQRSNAVLFLDEADAIFGKRTSVKDSHDRYANLDTAALLDRIDAYAGVVLLATNLRTSIDSAFSRRLRRVIDYSPK